MKKVKIVVKRKPIYRFNPVGDRNGKPSKFHRLYRDLESFTVNPVLLQQLRVQDCHETTPEGKAVWLYMRLCQLLKYDEKTFYHASKHNINNDLEDSFKVVGNVTADTPVSCYNFARIATKLLNQIEGVRAVMIMVGNIKGHLRFGFYTDRITVDCEPTTSINHFNDLARVKLGMMPQGLKFLYGKWLETGLMQKVATPMLAKQATLTQYLSELKNIPAAKQMSYLPVMVKKFQECGVDGNSAVQALLDWNRYFENPVCRLLRVGMLESKELRPQLLARENQKLWRIDLNQMQMFAMSTEELLSNLNNRRMVHVDEGENDSQAELEKKRTLREKFVSGLKVLSQEYAL